MSHTWTSPPTQAEIIRFLSFVEVLPSGCWFWTGARSRGRGNKKWYGSFHYRGQSVRAHRFSCDCLANKPCPPGHHRGHTCHFSLCVHPEHLVIMTREQNQLDKYTHQQRSAAVLLEQYRCHV